MTEASKHLQAVFNGYRHGTITGFKVYRGLEKSRFQNHKKKSEYRSCGMHSFLCLVKDGKCRTPSVVCTKSVTSHTTPPPRVSVTVAVSESHLV